MFYFVVQRVGSLLLLYGGISGDTVASLTVLGLLLKMGLSPVHFWVPPVAGRLSRWMFGLLLTWQKLAPLSLLLFLSIGIWPLILLNVIIGAVLMLATRSLQPLLVFRGLVQIGWVLSLRGGALMWHYLALYYTSFFAVIAYQLRRRSLYRIALLNAGGLPPITGFIAKLRALYSLPRHTTLLLIAGRGAALASYVRMLLASKLQWRWPTLPLLAAIRLGAV